jgi:hypothetical protein
MMPLRIPVQDLLSEANKVVKDFRFLSIRLFLLLENIISLDVSNYHHLRIPLEEDFLHFSGQVIYDRSLGLDHLTSQFLICQHDFPMIFSG